MKRIGNLYNKIYDSDNLRLAFYKTAKGKWHKKSVLDFSHNIEPNLIMIREKLKYVQFEFGNYHYFTIYDPKERLICASGLEERIVHHAIMNICHKYFERYQIYDSYACRKNKGVYKALERAQVFSQKFRWYAKLDIRKHFDSICHVVLKERLSRMFKDNDLLKVFNNIIDSYETLPDKGLPIGNLTSQYFANHILAVADHYIKETLRVKGYVRYMDDMVIWDNDNHRLKNNVKYFCDFIETEINLNVKQPEINKNIFGLPFLNYRIYPYKILLGKRAKHRFPKQMKNCYNKLIEGKWNQECFADHVRSIIAFTEHASAKKYRQSVLKNIV